MKHLIRTLIAVVLIGLSFNAFASGDGGIVSIFKGSEVNYDDKIGFGEHYILKDDKTITVVEGKIRRRFCYAPKGRSPFEIIKNYEKAIIDKGGTIINLSRDAGSISVSKQEFIYDLFTKGRVNRMTNYEYMQLPNYANDYVAGKISTAKADFYVAVAAVSIEKKTVFTLVTVEAKPMDMGMVSLDIMNEGIARDGRIAIYDIHFESGKSEVKKESAEALKIIAEYLKKHTGKKYIVVGHTDNVGNFDANIKLSFNRAKEVAAKLVSEYGINKNQLEFHGVGPTSPKTSNSTKEGKARNRRVEIVEQ